MYLMIPDLVTSFDGLRQLKSFLMSSVSVPELKAEP